MQCFTANCIISPYDWRTRRRSVRRVCKKIIFFTVVVTLNIDFFLTFLMESVDNHRYSMCDENPELNKCALKTHSSCDNTKFRYIQVHIPNSSFGYTFVHVRVSVIYFRFYGQLRVHSMYRSLERT